LLELLLALTLMGVTVGAAYSMLRSGFLARRVAEDAAGQTRRVAGAMDILARSLRSAVHPGGLLAGTFEGDDAASCNSDVLTFHAVEDPYGTPWGDVAKVEYRLENTGDNRLQLIRRCWRNLLSSRAIEGDRDVLCRGVQSLEVKYFDGTSWYDVWDSTQMGNALPTAVGMTLTVFNNETASADSQAETTALRRVVAIPCAVGQGGQP
jgi:type II secretion system protein J